MDHKGVHGQPFGHAPDRGEREEKASLNHGIHMFLKNYLSRIQRVLCPEVPPRATRVSATKVTTLFDTGGKLFR